MYGASTRSYSKANEALVKEEMVNQLQVVLFPYPAQGHTLPALILAQRFIEAGACVKLVVLEDRVARVNAALRSVGIVCDDHRLSLLVLSSGRAPPETWSNTGHDNPEAVTLMAWQCHDAQGEFEEMVAKVKSSEATGTRSRCWIVSDYLHGWTQDAANKLGIPRYIFYPLPAAVLAGVFFTKTLQSEGRLPLPSSEPDSLVHIPGLPPTRTREMHSYLLDSVSELAREFFVGNCLRVHEAAGIFINSFEELEPVAVGALKTNPTLNPNSVSIFPVGPLLPGTELQIARSRELVSRGEKSLVWLNRQPPRSVIFVSFGSIVVLSDEQIEEVGRGLAASGHKFLWVLRAESGRSSPLLGEFDESDQGLVLENEWVPQLQILAHDSTGAFFTHGGWNSTLESLSHGVPMLVWSCFSDQAFNAKLVEDELGAGLRVDALERNLVADLVKRVMNPSSGLRGRAQAVKLSAKPARSELCARFLSI